MKFFKRSPIWPVAQMTIRSAFMLGAHRVIVMDRFEERLKMARDAGAETINFEKDGDVIETLKQMTGGRGPDACIEAVGMEAHTAAKIIHTVDKIKQDLKLQTDRPHAQS